MQGQSPSEFMKNELFLSGPFWLTEKQENWPSSKFKVPDDVPEKRQARCFVTQPYPDLFFQYSSYTKLKRIIA